MTTILPPVPRLVFTIFEPLTLIAGCLAPLLSPTFFVASQLGHLPPHPLYPTERVLSLQLGNAYFLLCLIGLFVLNTTTEARVVHGYVWALWVADIGHVAATAWVMGWDAFMNMRSWNATTIGNIGITASLFVVRSLYMAGWLGQDNVPVIRRTKTS